MSNWGYDNSEQIGPSDWAKHYPAGKLQSPINIMVDFCALNAGRHHHKHRSAPDPTCCCANNNGARHDQVSSLAAGLRRTHLDSIGEDDHQRSSSTSSSASSSPLQNNDSCEDDDDEDDSPSATTVACSKQRPLKQVTRCVDCFPSAKGRQIDQQNTRHCVSNKKLFLGYPRYMSSSVQLCNTGHSWQINIPPELGAHTLLSGPPLADREYKLAQVHAHWGENSTHGSEHQVNGKSFAAEIHFVHWNCTHFRSVEEASKHKHGLAVLGVLVMALEGEQNKNRHLEKIVAGLKHIKEPNSCSQLQTKLDLKKLFPANRWSYASYEGSLTTPPLSEVVDWIVFLEPITCSTSQIEHFQQINCETADSQTTKTTTKPMRTNCRPVQPTNNRLITIWTHPTTN